MVVWKVVVVCCSLLTYKKHDGSGSTSFTPRSNTVERDASGSRPLTSVGPHPCSILMNRTSVGPTSHTNTDPLSFTSLHLLSHRCTRDWKLSSEVRLYSHQPQLCVHASVAWRASYTWNRRVKVVGCKKFTELLEEDFTNAWIFFWGFSTHWLKSSSHTPDIL